MGYQRWPMTLETSWNHHMGTTIVFANPLGAITGPAGSCSAALPCGVSNIPDEQCRLDINKVKSHEITDNLGCELPVCGRLLKILGYLQDDDFEWLRPRVLLQPKAIRCNVVPLGLCESFCTATFFRGTGTGAGTGIASRAVNMCSMAWRCLKVPKSIKNRQCAPPSLSLSLSLPLSLVKFKHVGTKHHTLGMVTAIPLQQFLMLLFPRFETMSYRRAAVTKGCLWAACWAWFNKSKDTMNIYSLRLWNMNLNDSNGFCRWVCQKYASILPSCIITMTNHCLRWLRRRRFLWHVACCMFMVFMTQIHSTQHAFACIGVSFWGK